MKTEGVLQAIVVEYRRVQKTGENRLKVDLLLDLVANGRPDLVVTAAGRQCEIASWMEVWWPAALHCQQGAGPRQDVARRIPISQIWGNARSFRGTAHAARGIRPSRWPSRQRGSRFQAVGRKRTVDFIVEDSATGVTSVPRIDSRANQCCGVLTEWGVGRFWCSLTGIAARGVYTAMRGR